MSPNRQAIPHLVLCSVLGMAGCWGGVPRFEKVSDALYRGGQPDAKGFGQLKKIGVKTIVSLRVLDHDRRRLRGLGLRYLHVSFKHVHPEDEDTVAFLKVVANPENQPVFVHCRDGVDRTGMMVALYRIIIEDWPKPKALAEMKRMGFNPVWRQIEDYVEHLDIGRLKRKLRDAESPVLEVIR